MREWPLWDHGCCPWSWLTDRADALFICYQIDRELGGEHSAEAKDAVSTIMHVM
jgi:hypothetical protein